MTFSDWLKEVIKANDLEPVDLLTLMGLSETVDELYRVLRAPTMDDCYQIAEIFRFTPARPLRLAGYLPRVDEAVSCPHSLVFSRV